jgi:hypothetical protein
MANVLVSVAQFERRVIAGRTKAALAVKREQGIIPGPAASPLARRPPPCSGSDRWPASGGRRWPAGSTGLAYTVPVADGGTRRSWAGSCAVSTDACPLRSALLVVNAFTYFSADGTAVWCVPRVCGPKAGRSRRGACARGAHRSPAVASRRRAGVNVPPGPPASSSSSGGRSGSSSARSRGMGGGWSEWTCPRRTRRPARPIRHRRPGRRRAKRQRSG